MRLALFILGVIFVTSACSDKGADGRKSYRDLPFETAENAKDYADLILQSIKTNRDKPIFQEFSKDSNVNAFELKKYVGMYSTGIIGRDDWLEYDIHEFIGEKDLTKGFDFAWLEPSGRLGMQIFILPKQEESGRFALEKLEFRSRIEVMDSKGFPHGDIGDYKKLNVKW